MRAFTDRLLIALDEFVAWLPLPEGWDFTLSEMALEAKKRIAKSNG